MLDDSAVNQSPKFAYQVQANLQTAKYQGRLEPPVSVIAVEVVACLKQPTTQQHRQVYPWYFSA